MKKLERLQRIERVYGPEFVLPYRACYTWQEMEHALVEFWATGHTPSLRTDLRGGSDQGVNLPFVHPGCLMYQAADVWDRWGDRLVYIVCEGVSHEQTWSNVSAEHLSPDVLRVEWDDGNCAQRDWEHTCLPLHQEFVAENGWWHPAPAVLADQLSSELDFMVGVRARPPWALPPQTAMARMYLPVLASGDHLTVWTVRRDGRVVVW